MVYFYRQALFHPQTGRMVTVGTKKPLKAFAADLADECGEGQAQTFERYLRDNALQGYFVVTSAKGIDWIERTGKKYPLDRLGLKPEGLSPKEMALEAAREREKLVKTLLEAEIEAFEICGLIAIILGFARFALMFL